MTRVMELDESTRVNLLDHAVRGFKSTRGPAQQQTVCEVAALSSVDPDFIETTLRLATPTPDAFLADWARLAIQTDHEVLMGVLADRFGLDWSTVNIPATFQRADGEEVLESMAYALLNHDAVRMFEVAIERGWVNLNDRPTVPSPFETDAVPHGWLVHAIDRKASQILERLLISDLANTHHALDEALNRLSVRLHSHSKPDDVLPIWERLIGLGANPWLLDGAPPFPDHEGLKAMDVQGATPAHRMVW